MGDMERFAPSGWCRYSRIGGLFDSELWLAIGLLGAGGDRYRGGGIFDLDSSRYAAIDGIASD